MKYYIAEKSFYYGKEKNTFGFVQNELLQRQGYDGALSFDFEEDAEAWIENAESEIYVCSHNESGRPEYKILDEDAACDFSCVLAHSDMSGNQYDWGHCEDDTNPTQDEISTACYYVEANAWDNL